MTRPFRSFGDGDYCPVNPEHGRCYVLPAKVGGQRQWCPSHEHDRDEERPFFPLFPKNLAPATESELREMAGGR